jgi:hypothetical protein
MGELTNTYRILIRMVEGRRRLETLEENIKTTLKEIRCEDVYWMHLTQVRVK